MKKLFAKIAKWILNIAYGELPLWSFGLECNICQMTFVGPAEHKKNVIEQGIMKLHEDKIPRLG